MYFRRSGRQYDRRRVGNDTLLRYMSSARRRTPRRQLTRRRLPLQSSENYGNAEFLDELPRLADFVPTQAYPFLLVFLIGLGAVAGLEALFLWVPTRVSTWDLGSPACLATWLNSMLLALAAVGAAIVYSVRRFRLDDYRGHYRIWLWAALCWLLLSVDQTAHIRSALKELLVMVTGTPLYGDGSLWWIAIYTFLLGGVGTRLLVDMRHSWSSSAMLLATALGYMAALAARFDLVTVDQPVQKVMIQQGGMLAGSFLLFLSMGLHARYVLLDATGLLPAEGFEVEDRGWGSNGMAAGARGAARLSHGMLRAPTGSVRPPSPHQVATALNTLAATAEVATSTPVVNVNRRLTKEERRRLEEKLRRARLDREG
jgi:hypothetical protein